MNEYEKLVEEIGWEFCLLCNYFDIEMRCSIERWRDTICDLLRETTKNAIARTLKAVEDGDILLTKIPPELPEEEARTKELSFDEYHRLLWMGCTFIALRPSPGDSEEEKGGTE